MWISMICWLLKTCTPSLHILLSQKISYAWILNICVIVRIRNQSLYIRTAIISVIIYNGGYSWFLTNSTWSLYIRTGFSWSLYIQTNFLRSLYIMTEMMAVLIYNDRFRIRTITYVHRIVTFADNRCCNHSGQFFS